MIAQLQYNRPTAPRPYMLLLPAPEPAAVYLLPAWTQTRQDTAFLALVECEDLRPRKLRDWEMWEDLETEWRADQRVIAELMQPW